MVNEVRIDDEVQYFLGFLFGSGHWHMPEFIRESSWKRYCQKMVGHLERYVRANVNTDADHKEKIATVLNKLKDAAKEGLGREQLLVAGLVELCLLLMGEMPLHDQKKRVGHPYHFQLDQFRSLGYSQSPRQKAELIYQRCILPRIDDDKEAGRLDDLYWVHVRKGRHAEFIEYFKLNRRDEYIKLFI